MTINDGGPAYPVSGRHFGYVEDGRQGIPCDTGMSLRDYFAAAALGHVPKLLDVNEKNLSVSMIAEWSYEIADAMLRERGRKPE